jgi:hypothetical protein
MPQEEPKRMSSILRRRPSPAMVVALISLFLSLGGVSYGVATGAIDSREVLDNTVRSRDLRNNDVRTRDIRNNDIRSWDIRNNEVWGRDIRNGTITRGDVGLDVLRGTNIEESTLGTVPNAASVGGMPARNIRYTGSATTPARTILDLGGLRLQGSCAGGPQIVPNTAVPFIRSEGGTVTTGSGGGDLAPGASGQLHIMFIRSDGGHVEVTLGYRTDATTCAIGGHALAG